MRYHSLAWTVVLLAATATTAAAQRPALATRAPSLPLAAADTGHVITIEREVFQYERVGHRDPFVSLMKSTELRPAITDLRLTTVAFDANGRNSVAVLRDLGTKEQYRVKLGSQLGRMRVARIDQKAVTFTLEEFGYSRQQTLTLGDSTQMRTP